MPRILRGEALANAIYQATDKLEDEFAKVFIDEVRKLSRSKALQELLDEVEAGQLVGTGVTSRLNILSVPTAKLDELIRKAMGSAIRITNEKTGLKLSFDYRNPNVIQAARTMSIELSTTLTKTARQILEKTIGDAIEGVVTRRQAIKIIESRIGLIPAHAEAVDRYYERLIADGRKRIDAQRLADKYADRLLRYRATTIARTEIARATGIGQGEFWKQALIDGALPPKTKRVWITAADERVCEICGPMDGLQTEIGQPWMTQNGLVEYPSAAHPNCRCTQGIALTKDYLRMFREEIAERQDTIDALQKLDSLAIDRWMLSKFNPYHDELGRFTSGPGGNKAQSYRMSHQPDVESDSVRFYELDRAMPDLYSQPKNYIMSDADDYYGSREAISSAKKARGNPNAEIKIYRAVPKGVKAINPKDWVTTSKKYAMHHARSNSEYGKLMVVIEATAKAKDISFGGNDGFEFGYVGYETISKANPYHDELGRFTTANSATGGSTALGSGMKLGPEGVAMQVVEPIAELASHLDGRDYSKVVAVPSGKRQRVAEAYDKMPLVDEKAKPAYDRMAKELDSQFETIKKMGIKVDFVDYDPYKSFDEMRNDYVKNKRIKVMKTSVTGSHPYWSNSTNDKFRAVHDVFGHLATGRGFDRHGEEAAYQAHKSMMPPSVHRALATETRGQNAYVVERGDFPPQKVGLLPEELAKRYEKSVFKMASITADDDNLYALGQSHHVTGGRHFSVSKANKYHDVAGRFTSADNAVAPKGKRPKLKRGGGKKQSVKVEAYSPTKIPKDILTKYTKDLFANGDIEEYLVDYMKHEQKIINRLGKAEPYPTGHAMTEHQSEAVLDISSRWINSFQESKPIRVIAKALVEKNKIDYYANENSTKNEIQRLKTLKQIPKLKVEYGDDVNYLPPEFRIGSVRGEGGNPSLDVVTKIATTIQAIREAPKSVVWRGITITKMASQQLVVGAIHTEHLATATGRKKLALDFAKGKYALYRGLPVKVLLKITAKNIPVGNVSVQTAEQVASLLKRGEGDSGTLLFADERFISGKYKVTKRSRADKILIVEMEEMD